MLRVKIQNMWTAANKVYIKSNDTWSEVTSEDLISHVNGKSLTYEEVFTTGDTLSIVSASEISGTSCSLVAISDNKTVVTTQSDWSIVSGSEYATIDISTGVLTILSGASSSTVIVSAFYGGLTATKTITVTYIQGAQSETETETEVDESGNTTTVVTVTTTYEDGSQSVDASSEDHLGNVSERVTAVDASGNSVVTKYTIDTSGNESGSGKEIAAGVNTEFVPFDGSGDGFEMHIRFKSIPLEQPNPPIVRDTEDTGANYHFHLVSAMEANSPWPGFMVRWSLRKTNYSNGSMQLQFIDTGGTKTAVTICNAGSTEATTGLFDFTVAYDPNKIKYGKTTLFYDNINSRTLVSKDIAFPANGLDFTIGYAISIAGTPYRYANLTVYDFSITKL